MKKFLAISAGVASIIVLVILGIGLYLSTKFVTQPAPKQEIRTKAAPASQVYFYPGTVNLAPNENGTATVMIDPGSNAVTAVKLVLTYDASMLTITNIIPSNPFRNVLVAKSINPTTQTASITVTPRLPDTDAGENIDTCPATDPCKITILTPVATIYFQTTQSALGQTSIAFASNTVATAVAESANVITTANPLALTIVGPTPTDTPTPTPTERPTPTPTETPIPTLTPTPTSTPEPSGSPTPTPTGAPTATPTPTPGQQTVPLVGDIFPIGSPDGRINIYDYNLIVQNFSQTNCGNPADIDKNCMVNIFDYNLLVQNYGKTR